MEAPMKTIPLAAAAILMASTTAYAGGGISFEINGQKIHVEAPKNCDALSCIKITAPGLDLKGLNLGGSHDDDDATVAATAPAPVTPAGPAAASTPAVVASTTPVAAVIAPLTPAPVAATAPLPSDPAASATVPGPQPAPVAAAIAPASATPLGVWATEENKGNVRIEPCGANLCGYA